MAKIQDGNYISRKVNFEDKRLDEEFDAPDNFVIRFSPRDHSSEPILHMTLCDQWTNVTYVIQRCRATRVSWILNVSILLYLQNKADCRACQEVIYSGTEVLCSFCSCDRAYHLTHAKERLGFTSSKKANFTSSSTLAAHRTSTKDTKVSG
ncbi:hypothetical protein LguiB_024348 [Lonicera macranthoides]